MRVFIFIFSFLFLGYMGYSQTLNVVADDYGEQTNSNGYMYLSSSDLELCSDPAYNGGMQTVGIHFNGVSVPQGATITTAYIQFQADESNSGTVTINIAGEDVDDASTFSSNNYDVTNRTTTSASASWSPANWTSGQSGSAQKTSEIKTIVQEIVNRSGWYSGNDMVFILSNSNATVWRTAEVNPTLHIEYTGGNVYPTSSCTKSKNYLIKDVIFAGINNTGTGKSSYTDYSSQTANVELGTTYTLKVKIKNNKHKYLKVWIDWNRDYDFTDNGEEYILATDVDGQHTYTKSITVPAGASIGKTRMRVTVLKNSYPTSTGVQADKGEVEDYSVLITTPPAQSDLMYYVADADDKLYQVNRQTGACSLIGSTGRTSIETIANWPAYDGSILYAVDYGDFGTLNTTTGAFTLIGEIDGGGKASGADGPQSLNDVDGLALSAKSGAIWASDRRSNDYDLLFKINPATGHFIPDAFGSGVDYLVIDGTGIHYDIDDIAVSPVTGEILCTNNDGGSNDVILSINKATGAVTLKSTFQNINDCEGMAFANDGNLYVSEGGGNSLNLVNSATGTSTSIKDPLCGAGDVEALACLMDKANRMEGKLWKDSDDDGIKDANETTGIAGVSIKIYEDKNADGIINGNDEYLNTVVTDANGEWYFDFAVPGSLIATVDGSTLPSGYALTTDNIETATFNSNGNIDVNNNFGADSGSDCDGDGIPNFADGISIDSDGDGIYNQCDLDSDNDGILDSEEGTDDTDGDGVPDYIDLDSDNDGIPDAIEANGGAIPTGYNSSTGRITGSDSDSDGLLDNVDNAPSTAYGAGSTSTLPRGDQDNDNVKDYVDLDSDNDGILDLVEVGKVDSNGDGKVDNFVDNNGDGYNDAYTTSPVTIINYDVATESYTLPNYLDLDSDGDGMDDLFEGMATGTYAAPTIITDSDGDGILDFWDISNGGVPVTPYDNDGDGDPDYMDLNSDNDATSDRIEGDDLNQDGIADSNPLGVDADHNGIDDQFDRDCSAPSTQDLTAAQRAEEDNNSGSVDLTGSSDIELTHESNQQTVGLRFENIHLSQGTVISNAYIQFAADESQSGSLTLTFKCEDVDNSAAFTTGTNNISNRTTTSASVNWSPNAWTQGDEGVDQKTVNLTTILQEVVDRAGWSSGNAITIIITENGNSGHHRTAENNPYLHIAIGGATKSGAKGTTVCYACGTSVAAQDTDGNGERDFREDAGDGSTLPINLVELTAEMDGEAARIEWSTVAEVNNDYFILERSKDGVNFEQIAQIQGAGNSNVLINYTQYDNFPYSGISYYRLTQVDFDGTTSTTEMVALENNNSNDINVSYYPNPTDGVFYIQSSEDVEIEIRSIDGKVIDSKTIYASQEIQMDLSNYNKGLYFIVIRSESKTLIKKLILK